MLATLAAIPYKIFPEISLGPLTLRTFGLMFALGVVAGVGAAVRWGERYGVSSDEVIGLATRMVVAGVIGSRITWVLTNLDAVDSPLDVIAIWEGGLQYSGGFVAALIVGYPTFRHWSTLTKGRMLDAACLGLTLGIVLGRVGCYSVGEHFGNTTSFFLATRFEGGGTPREPVAVGEVIHNTALYEGVLLLPLALVLWLLMRRMVAPGTAAGVFGIWYALCRFSLDFLRVNDETVLGLTGAQWTCLVIVLPLAAYVLVRVRPRMAARVALEQAESGRDDAAAEGASPDDGGGGAGPISPSAAGSSGGTASPS